MLTAVSAPRSSPQLEGPPGLEAAASSDGCQHSGGPADSTQKSTRVSGTDRRGRVAQALICSHYQHSWVPSFRGCPTLRFLKGGSRGGPRICEKKIGHPLKKDETLAPPLLAVGPPFTPHFSFPSLTVGARPWRIDAGTDGTYTGSLVKALSRHWIIGERSVCPQISTASMTNSSFRSSKFC